MTAILDAVLQYAPIPYPVGTIGNILRIVRIIELVIWAVLMVIAAIRPPQLFLTSTS